MGVKTLWVVLEPVKDPTPLEDLKGQTIAVDLSSWICESIAAVNAFKPHHRNLFYRVVNLSRLNIQPVFVIDGDPPELKSNELVKRAHIQGDSKNKHGEKKPGMQRTRLKTLQYECCKLLDVLGVPYIQATGEAEAMCALLNKEGLVDGVFTEDGDAFLYGAKKVYKNLTAGSNGSHVDVYDMLDIEEKLTLNRNKLIAMALLMGCDYLSDGVPSVGKTNATQLMHSLGDIDVLERFHEWTQEKSQDDDPNQIVTSDEDDDGRSIKRKRRKKKRKLTLEEKIKCKALKIDGFPNQKVIDEFLIPKDVVPSTPFQHATPDFAEIMIFVHSTLRWPYDKIAGKALSMIASMEIRDIIQKRKSQNECRVTPIHIIGKCTRHFVPSLHVQWKVPGHEDFDISTNVLRSFEPVNDFQEAYPEMAEQYMESVAAEKALKYASKKSPEKMTVKNSAMLKLIQNAICEQNDVNGSSVKDITVFIKSDDDKHVNISTVKKVLCLGCRNGVLKACKMGRYKITKNATPDRTRKITDMFKKKKKKRSAVGMKPEDNNDDVVICE